MRALGKLVVGILERIALAHEHEARRFDLGFDDRRIDAMQRLVVAFVAMEQSLAVAPASQLGVGK